MPQPEWHVQASCGGRSLVSPLGSAGDRVVGLQRHSGWSECERQSWRCPQGLARQVRGGQACVMLHEPMVPQLSVEQPQPTHFTAFA